MALPVVGIDPSLAATGVAACDLEARKILGWECIRTKPDGSLKPMDDLVRRLHEIACRVRNFTASFNGVPILEGQVGVSFSKGRAGGESGRHAIFLMGTGYGAIVGGLPRKPIVLAPATVKKRVTGKMGASKEEAWQAAKQHFDSFPDELHTKPAREAVHDAVVAAVAGKPEIDQLRALLPIPASSNRPAPEPTKLA